MKLAELLEKYLDGMDVIAVKRYGSEADAKEDY